MGFRIFALLIKVVLNTHPAKSALQLSFTKFIVNFLKVVIDSKDWLKYSQNKLLILAYSLYVKHVYRTFFFEFVFHYTVTMEIIKLLLKFCWLSLEDRDKLGFIILLCASISRKMNDHSKLELRTILKQKSL